MKEITIITNIYIVRNILLVVVLLQINQFKNQFLYHFYAMPYDIQR